MAPKNVFESNQALQNFHTAHLELVDTAPASHFKRYRCKARASKRAGVVLDFKKIYLQRDTDVTAAMDLYRYYWGVDCKNVFKIDPSLDPIMREQLSQMATAMLVPIKE